MDRQTVFALNIQALSEKNPRLSSRLLEAKASNDHYRFRESKTGGTVPVYTGAPGAEFPLHSTIDPKREARRLIAAELDGWDEDSFIITMGLGGGFVQEAALEKGAARVLAIDFGMEGVAELFRSINYVNLLRSPRFALLTDPSDEEIKDFILERYQPALSGGVKVIPLRARTEADKTKFDKAALAVQEALKNTAADYGVQAHLGFRWFSNIIRNIMAVETREKTAPPVKEAAIAAAGPSLDMQIPALAELQSRKTFIISSDTALPALLSHGIKPDAAASIDCQHISYYHFIGRDLKNIPLFLDIASPPLLCRFSSSPVFFCGGHPLALYISQNWRPFPLVDASGGNITYACLSLAESLGAERVTLFGADFSYIRSRTYARGTYVCPFFDRKQNRLHPSESLLSAFLYRNPFLPRKKSLTGGAKPAYYETGQLRFYRHKLQEKASKMNAHIIIAEGNGAPIKLPLGKQSDKRDAHPPSFAAGKAKMGAREFLEQYKNKIAALPSGSADAGLFYELSYENRQVLTTLLPFAAAFKYRNPGVKNRDMLEEIKRLSLEKIERVIQD
ncbi:MAG: DUF115 domain-containing protein [Treponema sp.]|jgi:hypothetical protein|nr:DUF115 domain-containing protein [Treponema sp.]